MTKQRLAILEVLRGSDAHPDADWVYREVKKVLPHVSLGTVYRSLEVLRDAGLIASLEVGPRRRYDGDVSEHQHIFCTACGRVVDIRLPSSLLGELERRAASEADFTVTGHRVEFYGLCPQCRRKAGK
ncbi:MAG TPA: transcriptional repressor [Anaerolineae bacterium]|nr:transcriptional repressor [Anaerolineae bacterium]